MLKEENMNRKEGYMLKEKVVEDIKQLSILSKKRLMQISSRIDTL